MAIYGQYIYLATMVTGHMQPYKSLIKQDDPSHIARHSLDAIYHHPLTLQALKWPAVAS